MCAAPLHQFARHGRLFFGPHPSRAPRLSRESRSCRDCRNPSASQRCHCKPPERASGGKTLTADELSVVQESRRLPVLRAVICMYSAVWLSVTIRSLQSVYFCLFLIEPPRCILLRLVLTWEASHHHILTPPPLSSRADSTPDDDANIWDYRLARPLPWW